MEISCFSNALLNWPVDNICNMIFESVLKMPTLDVSVWCKCSLYEHSALILFIVISALWVSVRDPKHKIFLLYVYASVYNHKVLSFTETNTTGIHYLFGSIYLYHFNWTVQWCWKKNLTTQSCKYWNCAYPKTKPCIACTCWLKITFSSFNFPFQ